MNVLDGVRALAYLWVLAAHLGQAMARDIKAYQHWQSTLTGIWTIGLDNKGDQGVTSFFVLSGFLIVFILTRLPASRKETVMSSTTMIEFLFRRYMRLAPSIAMATFIMLAL